MKYLSSCQTPHITSILFFLTIPNVQNTIWMLEKLQQSAGTGARPAAYRDGQSTAIVPFDEFSKMFEEYTSLAAKEKAKREAEISASMTANEGVGRSSGSGENRRMSLRDIADDEDRFDPDAAMSAVQCLAKEDPLFDSFLKMSLRDKPAGRVSTYCPCCPTDFTYLSHIYL